MTPDIEALAQQLELHPDYKVLRRLTHTGVFNPALAGHQLCRGLVLILRPQALIRYTTR